MAHFVEVGETTWCRVEQSSGHPATHHNSSQLIRARCAEGGPGLALKWTFLQRLPFIASLPGTNPSPDLVQGAGAGQEREERGVITSTFKCGQYYWFYNTPSSISPSPYQPPSPVTLKYESESQHSTPSNQYKQYTESVNQFCSLFQTQQKRLQTLVSDPEKTIWFIMMTSSPLSASQLTSYNLTLSPGTRPGTQIILN